MIQVKRRKKVGMDERDRGSNARSWAVVRLGGRAGGLDIVSW